MGLPSEYILVVGESHNAAVIMARRVRAQGVFSEVASPARAAAALQQRAPRGVILVGEEGGARAPEALAGTPASVPGPGAGEGPRPHFLRDAAGLPLWTVAADPASWDEPAFARQLETFLFTTCGCRPSWSMAAYAEAQKAFIRDQVGSRRVICALSGGVDSAVAALLVHQAVGRQLVCVFVDHGLMRKGEPEQVVTTFRDQLGMEVVHVDAADRFFARLAGVADPEEKRQRIGREFIAVFEEEAKRVGDIEYLVQGTLYLDVLESGWGDGRVVKSHHNVGGLPERMQLKLLEPLRLLFKDEVRELGRVLGLPEALVERQPFPGPGLAVRVVGPVTREKVAIAREADHIVVEEIRRAGLQRDVWQSFAVLSDTRTVGVSGGHRTYGYLVGVRAVSSVDGSTARWSPLPWDVLDRIAQRIMAEVPGVNRVVYDISSKPPATIEWE